MSSALEFGAYRSSGLTVADEWSALLGTNLLRPEKRCRKSRIMPSMVVLPSKWRSCPENRTFQHSELQ
jgi:hypothetical protein